MSDTNIVCENCKFALLEGAEIPAEWCAGCDRFMSVEETWLIPEDETIYGVDIDGQREWRISQDHAEALEMARQERELDEFTPSQQSGEREPVRQRVNGWPGRKARKVRNG